MRKFLVFLGSRSGRGLEEVSRAQITAFRDHQLSQSASATANTDLKIIRRIFRLARLDGYLLQDPVKGSKRSRTVPPSNGVRSR